MAGVVMVDMNRYVHADGSANAECWIEITSTPSWLMTCVSPEDEALALLEQELGARWLVA